VRSIQVDGPLVLGKYDYTYSPKTAEQTNRNFFLFDTRTGKPTDFATENQLQDAAKVKIILISNESFHGPRTTSEQIASGLFWIALALPGVIGLWLLLKFVDLIRISRRRPEPAL
jgi:hypothetical protein